METEHSKSALHSHDDNLDWESRLERLRQTRQLNQPHTHAPLIKPSHQPHHQKIDKQQIDVKMRDKVLQEYLLQWQKEHNAELETSEMVETDTMVLLQENWLAAQSALQMGVTEKQIESHRTVWLNPKRQTVVFPEPENKENSLETEAKDFVSKAENAVISDGLEEKNLHEQVVVNINVLNPQVVNRKEVFCLSEQELIERLTKRMRPHITDAVNGMIRVAVQKQMALITYQLQQTLNEQAPQLVEEVLDYNLKKVLSEIKYDLKYKR